MKKKAVTPIIGITFLLLLSVIVFFVVQNWYTQNQSSFEISLNSEALSDKIEILEVNSTSILLDNDFRDNLPIDEVFINGSLCSSVATTISLGQVLLQLSNTSGECSYGNDLVPYKVTIVSLLGIKEEYEVIRFN